MNSLPRAGLRRITFASVLVFSVSLPAFAQETLTLYTTREPGLIQPLLDSWTKPAASKSVRSISRTVCLSALKLKVKIHLPTC